MVAYTPKDEGKEERKEERLNLTADQNKHKKSLSQAPNKDSLEKISNNLYFEFHSSEGTPDLQNVVFAGKPKANSGMVLIKDRRNLQHTALRNADRGA